MKFTFLFNYLVFAFSIFAINSSVYETIPAEDSQTSVPITEINSLKEIVKILGKAGPDSLIVFDVDEVLVTSKDAFFHPFAEGLILDLAKQEIMKAKTEEEQKIIEEKLCLGLIETERVLIEKISPEILTSLSQKRIKAIALTSFPSGRFGKIEQIEKWRVEHLKTFGLDFSIFFPKFQRQEFSSLKKPSLSSPIFENGILFSRGYSKGEVLLTFLDLIKWKPQKVIFIDDILENHKSLYLSLKTRQISFQGFLYKGAEVAKHQVDKKIIEFQFRHLIQHGSWLSDEEVKKVLKTRCKQ